MENPVVHFEIIGKNPKLLRDYYEKPFGWRTRIDLTVAPEVSDKGSYGFIEWIATGDGTGMPEESVEAKVFETVPFSMSECRTWKQLCEGPKTWGEANTWTSHKSRWRTNCRTLP
jgi:hypothetical protein